MDNVVNPFYESNKAKVSLILRPLNNLTNQQQFYEDFEGDLAYIFDNKIDSPYIMLRNENITLRIYGENLIRTNLEKTLNTFSTSNQTGGRLSSITPRLDPNQRSNPSTGADRNAKNGVNEFRLNRRKINPLNGIFRQIR